MHSKSISMIPKQLTTYFKVKYRSIYGSIYVLIVILNLNLNFIVIILK